MTSSGNVQSEKKLTAQQWSAVNALLLAATIADAAQAAKVNEKTVRRWLEDPVFVAALEDAQREALAATLRRLTAMGAAATSVIAGIMADKGVTASVRLRAADTVLARLLQWREVMQLEERLAALEVALKVGGPHD